MKKFNIVLVGGGSTWTPGLLKALCKRQSTFPLGKLVMYDINAERQQSIVSLPKFCLKKNIQNWTLLTLLIKK